MNEFDRCRFCLSYDDEKGCKDTECWGRHQYRIDVDKIIDKARERNISVTDVLNLIRECDEGMAIDVNGKATDAGNK